MNILDKLRTGISSSSADETQAIAGELAKHLNPDATLALHGDLGSGKTTFIQGLARAWGIDQAVTSPSFNIFNIYKGEVNLLHMDAYRLNSKSDAENLLIEDFLISPWCLAIEWPENIDGYTDENTMHLYFEIEAEQIHKISLKP